MILFFSLVSYFWVLICVCRYSFSSLFSKWSSPLEAWILTLTDISMDQVRELAEKESENGVFKMLRSDVTRFLTTILIGTTYSLFMFSFYVVPSFFLCYCCSSWVFLSHLVLYLCTQCCQYWSNCFSHRSCNSNIWWSWH